jgi:hypothetical protein
MARPDGGSQRDFSNDRTRPRPLLSWIVRLFGIAVAGGSLGLYLTYLAIRPVSGFGAVAIGPWSTRPNIGTDEIDPYARAMLAVSGELPLGTAEGLSFVARTESSGSPLTGGCDYRITGNMPRARYWTLALNSPRGEIVANIAGRYAFTSAEILRSADGPFEIIASRRARAGNWLPIGRDAPFVLVLRLYDTAIDTRSVVPEDLDMPRIEKLECR